jgi:hypothetical protein
MGDACGIEGGSWYAEILYKEERSQAGMAYSLWKTFAIKLADLLPLQPQHQPTLTDTNDCKYFIDKEGILYAFNIFDATWRRDNGCMED